ncbi:MAG: phosphoribosylanthranilate isomerase [Syntrophotaleaceae bacterium]
MPRVKICGITSREDALHAVDCGADALGLVFYTKSPRYLSPERARDIVGQLPPFVTAVGLFVNCPGEEILRTAVFCGLYTVQLHGDESPLECRLAPLQVLKALRVRDESSLGGLDDYPVGTVLLDAWSPAGYGGTGQTFNWQLAARAALNRRIILAGGLTAENVADAVRTVRPYAVDVSSGVESAPGQKDPRKVAAFIRNAKRAMES